MKLTGPRLERAMLRQARRVPNDKGSSWSTVGELKPSDSNGGNSSKSIPCKKTKESTSCYCYYYYYYYYYYYCYYYHYRYQDQDPIMIVIIIIIFLKLPYLTKLNERQIQDAKFPRIRVNFFSSIYALLECVSNRLNTFAVLWMQKYMRFAILMQCSRIQNYSTIYLVEQHSTYVGGELP